MQPPAHSPSSPAPPNFAGILAAIASPTVDNPELAKAWAENELGDDVVTLSYERALSQHARYKPQPFPDRGDVPIDWKPEPAARVDGALTSLANRAPQDALAIPAPQDALDRDFRTTSVTFRLSKGECERLHQRAAEAGLTVSAYLRSCTIEAEALRAQVKEALAGLRSAAPAETKESGTQDAAAANQRDDKKRAGELVRVLARIGNLCLGISMGKRA